MYEELGEITLKSGERVQTGMVVAPDLEWAERIDELLAHKGEPWNWQTSQVLRSDLGIEVRFYLVHRSGRPISNVMTVEFAGVGILGMLFVFSDIGLLPMWLVLVNLFRELLISGIRAVQAAQGRIVPANWVGKLKFCLQVVVVALGFVHLILKSAGMELESGRHIIIYCTLLMTLISLALAVNFLRWHGEGLMEKRT